MCVCFQILFGLGNEEHRIMTEVEVEVETVFWWLSCLKNRKDKWRIGRVGKMEHISVGKDWERWCIRWSDEGKKSDDWGKRGKWG